MLCHYICIYSSRDQTVRFAYITCLWVEVKQVHIIHKPKHLRQWTTKYFHWEIMLIVWTVYASLPATAPTPLTPFPLTSDGCGMHGFILTTVPQYHVVICFLQGIIFNPLQPSGNYMSHLLQQSVTLNLYLWVSYDSYCKKVLYP
jgi:hypothetical protein